MRKTLIRFVVLVCTTLLPTIRPDEAEYQKIRQHMSNLAPLNGKWDVVATFHRMDGSVTQQVGTWSVSSVLDDTYLEFQTERHSKNTPERSAKVFCYITFDPKSNQRSEHKLAQEAGKKTWYPDYVLRVVKVERAYGTALTENKQ